MASTTNSYTDAEKVQILTQLAESGLSVKAYCEQDGVSVSQGTIYNWRNAGYKPKRRLKPVRTVNGNGEANGNHTNASYANGHETTRIPQNGAMENSMASTMQHVKDELMQLSDLREENERLKFLLRKCAPLVLSEVLDGRADLNELLSEMTTIAGRVPTSVGESSKPTS